MYRVGLSPAVEGIPFNQVARLVYEEAGTVCRSRLAVWCVCMRALASECMCMCMLIRLSCGGVATAWLLGWLARWLCLQMPSPSSFGS